MQIIYLENEIIVISTESCRDCGSSLSLFQTIYFLADFFIKCAFFHILDKGRMLKRYG